MNEYDSISSAAKANDSEIQEITKRLDKLETEVNNTTVDVSKSLIYITKKLEIYMKMKKKKKSIIEVIR